MSKEENVYDDETRDNLVENDEISPEEEGFMKGYEEQRKKEKKKKKKEEEQKDEIDKLSEL